MWHINYKSWHQMSDSNKNQTLENIKIFALEISDNYVKKDREQVRTSSRQKQKFTHTAGSKSFAYIDEAEELPSSQKVGRCQLFDITHRKKDESPMTSEAIEIMEKLKDKKTEYETIVSSDSSINVDDIDNRIITEVLGPEKYGWVRFQGSFVNPKQYFGSSSQQYMPSGSQAQVKVQRLRDQMA
ncbi:Magnesium-protoporphyrin IX monomethyl ester [oxidative] cyclase 2 [Gossypium arboreum]|uniref:Magnesium-protoporphyrin IX monomethyl ester [oxidative] cyclase 2 n=1 Tax=Gossypium arboreum TaxID=29729 RepID=A0A0B0P6D1_GOSAR|nr:Magnesium-protoporphyrin IX monomethyl ester [oxidative] cyclase 2 [Gossypium arboreum]